MQYYCFYYHRGGKTTQILVLFVLDCYAKFKALPNKKLKKYQLWLPPLKDKSLTPQIYL
jgi:hypothetical protein